jgi:hypothetical protein
MKVHLLSINIRGIDNDKEMGIIRDYRMWIASPQKWIYFVCKNINQGGIRWRRIFAHFEKMAIYGPSKVVQVMKRCEDWSWERGHNSMLLP